MKKKLISSGIILFVLSYVLVAGFLIIKTSFTDGYSNAQLLANFLVPITPASGVSIAHLADATSAVAEPTLQQQLSLGIYQEISPIVAPSSTDVTTDTTSTTTDATSTATADTTTTEATTTGISETSNSSTTNAPNTSTAEQNLEILAATLIHLEVSSTTALQ